MKRLSVIILGLIISYNLMLTSYALAAPPACPIEPNSLANIIRRTACKAGFITADDTQPVTEERIAQIIGNIIGIALAFTGVVFIVLIIYGGWLWGTARGNEEQVQEAEKLIRNAVLGVIIVFAVFAISRFVIYAIEYSLKNPT